MKKATTAATGCLLAITGCATSPYDFPQPVMVGEQHGYSMMGYVKKDAEEVMRDRIAKRAIMACRWGVNYTSIKFDDTGIHPLGAERYEAMFTCKPKPE